MTPYQPATTTSGEPVALFGVESLEDGTLTARGSHARKPLRVGRLVKVGKAAYRLATPIPAGLALEGGEPIGHGLETPIILTPKKWRRA